ncbi:hypothetical protein BpHYR1_008628 [Brachionus plicatilis]|uniref:Uncharacterized protein n=1 Tax=Brachionus plicatilis TaxID=10195 RepID=A0A3M7RYV0_BRAPC|nr:hypothetical protein BpHYR1_008628 [Brachionus plicatilis]
MSSSDATSLDEIVKYQQELLGHQRNQTLIQKETIKILNALNKSLALMSDRLDEFAVKTNVKLDDGSHCINSTPPSQIPSVNHCMPNDVIYLTAENLNSSINSICNNVNTTLSTLNSTQLNNPLLSSIKNSPQNLNDIKDIFILGDFNSNILDSSFSSASSHILAPHLTMSAPSQPAFFFNKTTKLNAFKINHPINYPHNNQKSHNQIVLTPTLNSINLMGQKNSKLLDTSTSDESIGELEESFEDTADEEKEMIQSKKKIKQTSGPGKDLVNKTKDNEESNNQQRLFNKFVRESVERRLGKEFLLMHEIQEINQDIMEDIKKEALEAYPPINIRPRRAWHLAKASLRCRRRSLRRQKEKQVLTSTMVSSVSSTTSPNAQNSAVDTIKMENQSFIDSNLIQPSLSSLSTSITSL